MAYEFHMAIKDWLRFKIESHLKNELQKDFRVTFSDQASQILDESYYESPLSSVAWAVQFLPFLLMTLELQKDIPSRLLVNRDQARQAVEWYDEHYFRYTPEQCEFLLAWFDFDQIKKKHTYLLYETVIFWLLNPSNSNQASVEKLFIY